VRGHGLRRLRTFLKTSSLTLGANLPTAKFAKVLRTPKTFKKHYLIIPFLKVLGILKGLFQKSLKRVQGRALADKPKFED
jgi:hypothetical protein